MLSHVGLFSTLGSAACQAYLSFTISLLKLMSIESVMLSSHLILCCLLLLSPSTFPSIGVFSTEEAVCIGLPKYWSFSFGSSPSSEYSGLISCRIDWFDLFALQRTFKSLLHTTVQKHQFFGTQKSRMLQLILNGSFSSPPAGSTRGFFSKIYYENMVKLLEINLQYCDSPP